MFLLPLWTEMLKKFTLSPSGWPCERGGVCTVGDLMPDQAYVPAEKWKPTSGSSKHFKPPQVHFGTGTKRLASANFKKLILPPLSYKLMPPSKEVALACLPLGRWAGYLDRWLAKSGLRWPCTIDMRIQGNTELPYLVYFSLLCPFCTLKELSD